MCLPGRYSMLSQPVCHSLWRQWSCTPAHQQGTHRQSKADVCEQLIGEASDVFSTMNRPMPVNSCSLFCQALCPMPKSMSHVNYMSHVNFMHITQLCRADEVRVAYCWGAWTSALLGKSPGTVQGAKALQGTATDGCITDDGGWCWSWCWRSSTRGCSWRSRSS